MKRAVALLLLVSGAVSAETFNLVCEVHPVANERMVTTRVYRIDTVKQTVDEYRAVFSDSEVVVEKPFLENGPHSDKLATYTFNRVSGRLEIVSDLFGIAPFRGVCRKDPQPKF